MTDAEILNMPLATAMREAAAIRDRHWGQVLTYSRKVFIPLTQLCRDVCHYCTFATQPSGGHAAFLTEEQVLEIARAGKAAGCTEALFTLGDKPELRYRAARDWLAAHGFATTLDYLAHVARLVLDETGLLPHLNPGLLTRGDYALLRPVSASMGFMLETVADRLSERGLPHHGSPDKLPARRLESIALAGEMRVPFTSGLLIGIGETRAERLDALHALAALHAEHGHLQEVIIQNFRAKPGTRMAAAAEPDASELLWTIAATRLVLPQEVSLQAPPNPNAGRLSDIIDAGVNDWGGISPVTIDHVNPEAPWPEIERLDALCAGQGFALAERLACYPVYIREAENWVDPAVRAPLLHLSDAGGLAREVDWSPGEDRPPPVRETGLPGTHVHTGTPWRLDGIFARALAGASLDRADIVTLFEARGDAASSVVEAADELRRSVKGDTVTYVLNRNINYTNICTFSCSFCAFSKTSAKGGLRDKPYTLDFEEIAARAVEARQLGATEVCLQGGIHPAYSGDTYLDVVRAVKRAVPDMHVHAFSPLEVSQGAATLGIPVARFLAMLRDEGLGSLPGTAAEILDDGMRAILCPDKLSTAEWLHVVGAAHKVGLPTTSTIMFGHVEHGGHWADHVLALRRLQLETGGITEFVPLPFVHMASPIFVRGQARRGPTWRETVLMHAVGRLALHGAISNIQASWVKLGLDGATALLRAGVNDLGGTLINESISRAAGASHGQGLSPVAMVVAITGSGRAARQRSTLYADAASEPQAVRTELVS